MSESDAWHFAHDQAGDVDFNTDGREVDTSYEVIAVEDLTD